MSTRRNLLSNLAFAVSLALLSSGAAHPRAHLRIGRDAPRRQGSAGGVIEESQGDAHSHALDGEEHGAAEDPRSGLRC